jgi:hypothetical protein
LKWVTALTFNQSKFRQFWQYLAFFGNFWQFLAIFGNFWQFLAIFGNFWQFLAIFGNYLSMPSSDLGEQFL